MTAQEAYEKMIEYSSWTVNNWSDFKSTYDGLCQNEQSNVIEKKNANIIKHFQKLKKH